MHRPAEAMSFLFCGGSSQGIFHIHARQVQEATKSFPGLPVQFAMEQLWIWTDYAKIPPLQGVAAFQTVVNWIFGIQSPNFLSIGRKPCKQEPDDVTLM